MGVLGEGVHHARSAKILDRRFAVVSDDAPSNRRRKQRR